MFSRSVNDISRVVIMMIVGDATTMKPHLLMTLDDVIIYDCNMQATGLFQLIINYHLKSFIVQALEV